MPPTLNERWKTDECSPLRQQWAAILDTDAWAFVKRMAEEAVLADSEAVNSRSEGDPVLARALSRQIGGRSVLKYLSAICDPEPQPTQELEPYAHITHENYSIEPKQHQ